MPHRATLRVVPPSPVQPVVDKPGPYTVRKFRGVRGMCTLVMHDDQGEPYSEFRCPDEDATPDLVGRLQRWVRIKVAQRRQRSLSLTP